MITSAMIYLLVKHSENRIELFSLNLGEKHKKASRLLNYV